MSHAPVVGGEDELESRHVDEELPPGPKGPLECLQNSLIVFDVFEDVQGVDAAKVLVSERIELLTQNACLGCHPMDGAGPPIGPSFDGMGSRISADRIRSGILDPAAEVAEGFDQFAGMMPPTFGRSLSAQQLEIIVQFLVGRR